MLLYDGAVKYIHYMSRPRPFLFLAITVIECIVLIGLGAFIFFRYQRYREPVVIPIRRDQIEVPSGSTLSYFYTYKPNQDLIYTASFSPITVTNKTNADGLVDRFDYAVPKPKDVFRIVAVGDSFTQGVFVNTEESFPERTEDLLAQTAADNSRRIEVLNFGVGGYDIEYASQRLRLLGMKYAPDLVVWLQKFDDYYHINERTPVARGSFNDELISAGIPHYSKELETFLMLPHLLGEELVKQRAIKSALHYQKSRFMEVRSFYRGPILIVTLADSGALLDDVISSVQRLDKGIYAIQIQEEISRFPDSHPDQDGHRTIAEAVAVWVTEYLKSPASSSGTMW